MNNKYFLILLLAFLTTVVVAQPLRFVSSPDEIPVEVEGRELSFPWAGGLNAVKFSNIDLNNDGVQDILAFDRSGDKLATFLVFNTNGEVRYEYTEDYNDRFPAMRDWVLLYDYNCDDQPDIFTYMPGGLRIYKNTTEETGSLSFELHTPQNTPVGSPLHSNYGSSGYVNIIISEVNIPALYDVDSDGDMDILTFGSWGSTLHYHKNLSIEKYGHCDSLDFELTNRCWGYFSESFSSNSLTLFDTCDYNVDDPEFPSEEDLRQEGARHEGATLCALDGTGNGLTDMILGDLEYWEMTLLTNGGEANQAGIIAQDNSFPAYDEPIHLPEFPGAFYVDADGDDKKDLLVSPNLPNNSLDNNSVWFYKNVSDTDAPVFEFQQTNFLQLEMIDVGDGAIPVLVDLNQDGLEDLVISNVRYFDTVNPLKNQFMLLLNVGTENEPRFKLHDTDFLQISQYDLGVGLVPTFGDLNADGKVDMIIGDFQGNLHYFENNSQGEDISFGLIQNSLTDGNEYLIDVGFNASPYLYDYSGDGIEDLIIGCRNGNIWYYENTNPTNFQFELVTDSLGLISTALPSYPNNGFSTPIVRRVNDQLHIFVGSRQGEVYHYKATNDTSSEFELVNSNSLTYQGEKVYLTAGNLFGDGRLSFLLGNSRGGVSHYVQELVFADFSVEEQEVCLGDTIEFVDASQGGAVAWEWEFDGGSPASSNQQNPYVVYENSGVYSVRLTTTFLDGEETVEKEGFITVQSLPDGEIVVIDTLICSSKCTGALEVLTDESLNFNYLWSNQSDSSVAVNLCEGVHYLWLTDEKGCQSILGYDFVAPEVELNYDLELLEAGCGEANGCAKLTNLQGGTVAGDLSVEWFDESTGDSLCDLYAGSYTFELIDANECRFMYDFNIENPNAPTVTVEAMNATCEDVCDGNIQVIIEDSTEQVYLYEWSFGLPNSSVQQELCEGIYSLIVVDEELCQSTEMIIEIEEEYPNPAIHFSPSTYFVELSVTPEIQFYNSTTGATEYLWDFGDGMQSSEVNPVHQYLSEGEYSVVLRAYNGPCFVEDSVVITVQDVLSVEEDGLLNFVLYPNPVSSILTIKNSQEALRLKVFNLNGALVDELNTDETTIQLDMTNFKEGVYYIVFNFNQTQEVRKIVVVR